MYDIAMLVSALTRPEQVSQELAAIDQVFIARLRCFTARRRRVASQSLPRDFNEAASKQLYRAFTRLLSISMALAIAAETAFHFVPRQWVVSNTPFNRCRYSPS